MAFRLIEFSDDPFYFNDNTDIVLLQLLDEAMIDMFSYVDFILLQTSMMNFGEDKYGKFFEFGCQADFNKMVKILNEIGIKTLDGDHHDFGDIRIHSFLTEFILDRYLESSKMLPEGVSDYVPFVGDLSGVLATLKEGLMNGMIYAGARNIQEMKDVDIGIVTAVGQREQSPHDLLGKF